MGADESLFDFIERVRAFGRDAARDVAKEAAPRVEAALRETAAAGTDPYGKPWEPNKDGTKPLANAGKAIKVVARGEAVVATLTGPEVYHHYGTGRLPARPLLPDGGAGLPPKVAKAMRDSADVVFQRTIGGAQ